MADVEIPPPADAAAAVSPVLDRDVACPLCEYNLRGLTEPRCPECGYTFAWPELTDPTRRRHPFLFEHYAGHNVWSFFRTLLAGLRPGKFWRSLSPAQPSFPRRLAAYAVVSVVGAFLAALVTLWLLLAALIRQLSVAWPLGLQSDPFLDVVKGLAQGAAYFVLWAASTFAALMVFRISMRRARIHPVHVARSVVYSFDIALSVALVTLAIAVVVVVGAVLFHDQAVWHLAAALVGAPYAVVALAIYRLVAAYRHYLRFDRPFLTVLASQVIAWLVVLIVFLYFVNG